MKYVVVWKFETFRASRIFIDPVKASSWFEYMKTKNVDDLHIEVTDRR